MSKFKRPHEDGCICNNCPLYSEIEKLEAIIATQKEIIMAGMKK